MKIPLLQVIKDINNYLFLRKTIEREKSNPLWKKYNLRVDKISRIYTVVSLPPEVAFSPDDPKEIRPAYVLEESRPINEYLTSLNLHEIIVPVFRPIENSDSYLIIYTPVFQKLSLWWAFSRIFFITFLVWLQLKIDYLGFLYLHTVNIIDYIISFIKV